MPSFRSLVRTSGGTAACRNSRPLFIPTKTTDHHIQHIYNKVDVSTRVAGALWAIQNALVG